jgi:hypothetical protein
MPQWTPTTDDVLRKEAVDLATDVATLAMECRDRVRPGDAYIVAMECVKLAGHIQSARERALPWAAARDFERARLAAGRALAALDRAGAHADLPAASVATLGRRLSDLAKALGALARD